MTQKNITQKFRITVLSPVHIGSGLKKMRGIDFYCDQYHTYVIDLDRLAKSLASNREALNELENLDENHSVGDLIKNYHLNPEQVCLFKYNQKVESREYLEFIRTGLGQPFIPGSSLKGALRTAILKSCFDSKTDQGKRELLDLIRMYSSKCAAEDMLKNIFGKNPNYNLMRVLIPTDAHFTNADLMLIESRVLSQTQGGWRWKPINYNRTDVLMRIWGEALKPNSKAELTLALDDFLLTNPKASDELKFPHKLAADIGALIRLVNDYSLKMLEAEIQYLEKREDERAELGQLLYNLETIKKHIPTNNSALVLRLGWGSGWESMTGGVIKTDQTIFSEVRRNLRLGRPGMPFPKSRKIGFSYGKPSLPFGWIKLEVSQ